MLAVGWDDMTNRRGIPKLLGAALTGAVLREFSIREISWCRDGKCQCLRAFLESKGGLVLPVLDPDIQYLLFP